MATLTIREMTPDDVERAQEIEEQAYREPWTARVFADELGQPNRRYVVADLGHGIAGYAGIMLAADEAHVTTIVADPAHREARVGTRLMLALVEAALAAGARSLTLEVRTSNERAQALYRRFGMAPVGVRKNYYKDEDALIMWAHDIDGPEFAERMDRIRQELEDA
jgi:ribosomal-protein-alanine N-acetyltransferase